MTHQTVVDGVGAPALHAVSAGLTAASIAGAWGYVSGVLGVLPIIIAACAGCAAIVSYIFATLDSPTFQRRVAAWQKRRHDRKVNKLTLKLARLSAKEILDSSKVAETGAREFMSTPPQ